MSAFFQNYSESMRVLLQVGNEINSFYLPSIITLFICGFAILFSVFLKLFDRSGKSPEKKVACSVATLSMTVFFFSLTPLISRNIGTIRVSFGANLVYFISGLLITVSSAISNIYARYYIKGQWSNQIEIQKDHKLITGGPYSCVRHPMYSSLILFGLGTAALFVNFWIAVLTLCVFIPMMIYRACSEEKELSKKSGELHGEYSANTPMLLPRLGKRTSLAFRFLGIGFVIWIIILNQFTFDQILALGFYHFLLSFCVDKPDVSLSFKIKPFMLLLIYAGTLRIPAISYGYYVILGFLIMGLRFRCPGMQLYYIIQKLKESHA